MEMRGWERLERGWRERQSWGASGEGWRGWEGVDGRGGRTGEAGAAVGAVRVARGGREGERAPAEAPAGTGRRWRREAAPANQEEPRSQDTARRGSWKRPPPRLSSPRRALGGAGRCCPLPRSRPAGCPHPSRAAAPLSEVLGQRQALSERGPGAAAAARRGAAAPAVLPQGRLCPTPAPQAARLFGHSRGLPGAWGSCR